MPFYTVQGNDEQFSMKFLVSIVVLLTALSGFSHPHHVSIATVTYNANTLAFEISLKTFSDDLEMALEKEFNSNVKTYAKISILDWYFLS